MKKIAFLMFFVSLTIMVYATNAPVTTTTTIINAVPGTTSVPVTVNVTGFSGVGQFTLTMKFDTTRVRYVSAVTNASLPGMTVTYTSPADNTQGKLIFAWTGASNVSLADGSAIANLTFSYITGTGILGWSYTYGGICQYKSYVGGVLTAMTDTPKYNYYYNGGISNRSAPVTTAPSIMNPVAGALNVPVTVTGFTSIGAMTLYLEYDPLIITYLNTFTKNAAFGSSLQIGSTAGTGGKMLIVIQWYTTGSPVTLAGTATMFTLNFTYATTNGTATTLNWFENGPSCEYADGNGDVLIDLPFATYYHNGAVSPALTANFSADNLTPPKNTTVHFTDLTTGGPTSWSWTFDRPGVVYVNGTSATSQNPQVQFTDGGLYTVTLVASNAVLSSTMVKTAYIRAGTDGLWTGNTSTAWYTLSNWDNYVLPTGTTEVTIPASATNWPLFTGDMTLGVQCGNIILSGVNSEITITGNLNIQ